MSKSPTPGASTVMAGATLLGLFVILFAATGLTRTATSTAPQPVSMDESASAMRQAGEAMQAHGQEMLTEGIRDGNAELAAAGDQWVRDGDALVSGGDWMDENPTAPGNLHASPAALQAQGSWRDLNRRVQAMVHDPGAASALDLEALRADGLAMQSEGRNMAAHGEQMASSVDLMVVKHKPAIDQGTGSVARLREAAAVVQEVGRRLAGTGQQMLDYVDRLRRSMGYND